MIIIIFVMIRPIHHTQNMIQFIVKRPSIREELVRFRLTEKEPDQEGAFV